jgi:Zn-dependent protease with chaperone function
VITDAASERLPHGNGATSSPPSTSTIRFTLLVALVVVTSAATGPYASLANRSVGRLAESAVQCLSSSGVVLGGQSVPSAIGSEPALRCLASLHQANLADMLIMATAVVVGGYLLYLVLPWWRIHRHRLTRLPADAEALHAYLSALVRDVGLPRAPDFLIAPYNRIAAGLAFGRRGRPMIQINAGLVPLFLTDRPTFRTIVLHELAHVRNRDIGKTYYTVAIWRTFLLVALVPFIVLNIFPDLIVGPDHWSVTNVSNDLLRSTKIQSVAAIAALTALIYLTRAAVLRSRENLADATAAAYGADALAPILGNARRHPPVGRVAALLRSHPAPMQRLRYLADPGQRYGFDLGEVFAAGVAISSICTSILFVTEIAVKATVLLPYSYYVGLLVSLFISLLYSVLIALYFSVIYWRVAIGATPGEIRTPALVSTAAVMTVGILVGEPLSIAGALSGLRLGVFGGVASEGSIRSGTVWVLLLFVGVFLLARWTRDSAALRLTRLPRPSFRTAYLGTAAIGGSAFLCGFWIWYILHGTTASGRVDLWTEQSARSTGLSYAPLPGAAWINAQYLPLEYLAIVPFATFLLALPWIYVVITSLRRPLPVARDGSQAGTGPPQGGPAMARVPVRMALTTGLVGGVFYVVITAVFTWLAAPWISEAVRRYDAAGDYLAYGYFWLAAVIGALVGGAVAAMAPRLGIALGLAGSYVSGTVAVASMPFTLALRLCAAPPTGRPTFGCLTHSPVGLYPIAFNDIIVRGGAAAVAAGLLYAVAVSVVRKVLPRRTASARVARGTADDEPTVARGTRMVVLLSTALLSAIALTATVFNTADLLGPPPAPAPGLQTALLTTADMPAGFLVVEEPSSGGLSGGCPPLDADPESGTIAHAQVLFKKGELGPFISERLLRFSPSDAQNLITRVQSAVDTCRHFSIHDQTVGTIEFSVSPLSMGAMGDATVAIRLTGRVSDVDVTVFQDVVAVRRGSIVILVNQTSYGSIDTDLTTSTLQKALGRAQGLG